MTMRFFLSVAAIFPLSFHLLKCRNHSMTSNTSRYDSNPYKMAFLKTFIFPHFQKRSGKDLNVRTSINDLSSYIRGDMKFNWKKHGEFPKNLRRVFNSCVTLNIKSLSRCCLSIFSTKYFVYSSKKDHVDLFNSKWRLKYSPINRK